MKEEEKKKNPRHTLFMMILLLIISSSSSGRSSGVGRLLNEIEERWREDAETPSLYERNCRGKKKLMSLKDREGGGVASTQTKRNHLCAALRSNPALFKRPDHVVSEGASHWGVTPSLDRVVGSEGVVPGDLVLQGLVVSLNHLEASRLDGVQLSL